MFLAAFYVHRRARFVGLMMFGHRQRVRDLCGSPKYLSTFGLGSSGVIQFLEALFTYSPCNNW